MLCSQCSNSEANVYFKAVINNKVIQLNLCEKCAKDKGVELSFGNPAFSITDLLSGLSSLGGPGVLKGAVLKCPACGLKYSTFKETGRLGCWECYQSFAPVLGNLIRRVHGSSQHQGKQYASPSTGANSKTKAAEMERLKKELALAIKKEDFEKAADLRDQIRRLES